METCVCSALDRPASELTVMDVYDIAVQLGQEFERVIDRFGCEFLVGVVHKVVRVLELLEALVSRGAARQEADELRRELERLRQERSDRFKQERKHQEELELVEDVWRGEVQDLLSQISQLQAENKRLLLSLPLKELPIPGEDSQKQDGTLEKVRQMAKKLEDLADKQRDEIRAKDHELMLRNEDMEALQMQQNRLIRINQDLRHRIGAMEARGKALIRQKAELEAAAQAEQQELETLQQEVTRLRKELRGWELESEVADVVETCLTTSGMPKGASTKEMDYSKKGKKPPLNVGGDPDPNLDSGSHHLSGAVSPIQCSTAATSTSPVKPCSVWVECRADPDFLANCFEQDKMSPLSRSSRGENKDEDKMDPFLSSLAEPDEDGDSVEEDSDKPRFTLQELRDVLQERNELKAQVFVLQEELAYYKSEELEDDVSSVICAPSPPPCPSSTDRPESGIRRLIFTAIMPMVTAGLIADDPTLLPIRRLLSSV